MRYWTEEDDNRIAEMLRDGLSASQIAARLGDDVTRNAIIGRVGRSEALRAIGFKRRPGGERTKVPPADRKPRPERKARPVARVAVASPPPLVPVVAPIPVEGKKHVAGLPMLKLKPGMCKWPVNDAAPGEFHLFCASPAEGPYCECHRQRSIGKGTESERSAHRTLLAA